MKIIDWYILKRFLVTFLFTLLILIPIAIAIDVSEKIDNFLEHPNLGLNEVLNDYYLNFIIYYTNTFMPLALFIAVILFTSKLSNNTEIIAITNAKVSFTRFMYPYFIGATLITILSLGMNHYVVPNSKGHILALAFIKGYHNSFPLLEKELAHLFNAIAMRLVIIVTKQIKEHIHHMLV